MHYDGMQTYRSEATMFGKQITFRLEKELYEKLEVAAKKQMRSVGGLIRLLLTKAVSDEKHLK